MRWTEEQVLAAAPDEAAVRAARGLASPGRWDDAGVAGAAALWGSCRGSGREPYRAAVDLAGPAYRCSCPSRKIPCKHVLALLLRWAGGDVTDRPVPGWVGEWLATRNAAAEAARTRAAAREARQAQRAAGENPRPRSGQSERRAAQRAERVATGVTELERWLADQVRHGLANTAPEEWAAVAARMVDAQAPGLARLVRRAAELRLGEDFSDRLVAELARLRLLLAAYHRLDALPEPLAATVRGRVGFPVDRAELLAGPTVRDRWWVLGGRDDEEDALSVRRVWLAGADTGRVALLLSYAAPGQAHDVTYPAGTRLEADLAYFPGTVPLRALVATEHAPPAAAAGTPPAEPLGAVLDGYARALAADPWLEEWPVVLAGAVPVAGGDHAVLVDGQAVPVRAGGSAWWRLVAVSGGRPVTLAGEWDGGTLHPLTAWADGRAVPL